MSFVLPTGWVRAPIADVILDVQTTDPSTSPSTEITYFDISSIDNEAGKVTDPKIVLGADAPSRARQVVESGDVLFSTVRPNLRAIAQVPDVENGIASTGFCVLRSVPIVVPKYLYFFVRSEGFLDALLPLQRGVSYPAVRSGDVVSQEIPLAPTSEQTRIVEKLEELLSDLDAGVAELKAAQKKLAQYRQSLLKAAVEGALTAEWRKHNPPQETGAQLLERILKERRVRWEERQLLKFKDQCKTPPKDWQKKYLAPVSPAANPDIFIPDIWTWTGLEQLSDGTPHGLKAGPFGSALKKEFYVAGGYKVYGQEQVIRGDAYFGDYFIPEEKYQELISCATKPGDLLISLVGTAGKVLMLPEDAKPGIINPRLLKISLAPKLVDPAYVKVVLESPYARHFYKLNAHGGTMDVLNLGILKELSIPLPSVVEQNEIVRLLFEQFALIVEQEAAISLSLKQSAAQRKNILKAAFSGQLVSQDPNDEPASVLLERIRAERAARDKHSKAPKNRAAKEAA